jgi:hypothetical protein
MFGEEKRPLTFRDFYKAKEETDSDASFDSEEKQKEEPWNPHKKSANEVKKGIYHSQLKKVIEASTPGLPKR